MFELLGSAITLVCAQDSFGTFLTTDSLPSVLCANFVNIAGKFTELDGRFLVRTRRPVLVCNCLDCLALPT